MLSPMTEAWTENETLTGYMRRKGFGRRDFLTYCAEVTALLGLSSALTPRIAKALENLKRPPVIWLQLQECTGCVETVLRTSNPTIGDLLLNTISLDFQHTIMAAAGDAAEAALHDAMRENRREYLLIVTGSVPLNENGIYTIMAGRTARTVLEEAAADAAAVLAVGACAHWGGVQAARPNPTGAVGVADIVKNKPLVNIAGCPPIADVVTATVVHYLTFRRLPELDSEGRPLFAYDTSIHRECPRLEHFEEERFASAFDDEGARKGWCLFDVGCKGITCFSPCPVVKWNTGTSWPIDAGHPCLGCTERNFWDVFTPFYRRPPETEKVRTLRRHRRVPGTDGGRGGES